MTDFRDSIGAILVVRFGQIGDVILTTPLLAALHQSFPQAKIDFAVKAEFRSLIEHHPAVNQVFAFDTASGFNGLKNLRREIDSRKYDLILDLHGSLRSVYLRLFGSAFMKRGYRKFTLERRLLQWARWNLLKQAPPVVDRYFTSVEDLGIYRDGLKPNIHLSRQAQSAADEKLGEAGLGGSPFIALAVGASRDTKRWPVERFGQAALELLPPGGAAVFLGGKQDTEPAAEAAKVLEKAGARAVNLCGALPLDQSAAVISRASLVLTNDSGLMHVADALSKPLVAVFGPTSRELGFYPQGDAARVAELTLSCRPCTLHGDARCPKGHFKCMMGLTVDAAVTAAKDARQSGADGK